MDETKLRKDIAEAIRQAIPDKDQFILWEYDAVFKWMNIAADIAEGPRSGYSTGKWSEDDDYSPITPFLGPIR